MLSILGRKKRLCDGLNRREWLRVGGLSMFGSLQLPTLLAARERTSPSRPQPARSVVLLNLFGGPPHIDMFDLKPSAPQEVRGEFKPISTSVPGVQISELLPKTALIMHHATLIRTYSHRYNSHNPYNVLTGYDGGNDRENYFAKVTDHPGIGSVCSHLGRTRQDVPGYVVMPAFPGYTQALRRAGPYGGYLGSQHDPLFTVCDPKLSREPKKGSYDPVEAIGYPTPPSLGQLPGLTAERFDQRKSLLRQLDEDLRRAESRGATQRMDKFKRQAFALLSSSKTRAAFDVTREPQAVRDRYGSNLWGQSLLIARKLVEVGTTFVNIHWESKGNNHWDLHENNFGMLKVHCPQLDQLISAFVLDLIDRGMMDTTVFIVMGEMGRTPKVNGKAGRDHWPQCGFALMFGGGMRQGVVVGETDKHAAYPTRRPVSAGDMVATIYHLLGVDPHLTVNDLSGRPIPISHGGEIVREALA